MAASSYAQDDDDDDDELPDVRPGVVARYVGADGSTHVRRDEAIQFVWGEQSPDPRLPPGKFEVQWSGRLFTIEPGEYQLHVYAAGEVRLKVAGQTLLDSSASEPGWLAARPIKLEYGYHPLEATYRKTGASAQVGLYWSGPKFQLEPLPDRRLFHEPASAPDERLAAGEQLARAMRCGACHEIPGERPAPAAPDLTRLSGNLSPDWLVESLRHDGHEPAADDKDADPPQAAIRRMPSFAFTAEEAKAIAACLLADSPKPKPAAKPQPAPKPQPAGKKAKSKGLKPGDRQQGETLFHSLGCLACHRQGNLGAAGLFGGGDLTAVASKRPADFFARWLENPKEINAAHRMPAFVLAPQERADLAVYLKTLKPAPSGKQDATPSSDVAAGDPALGKRLIQEHGCRACHALPKGLALEKPTDKRKLGANARWELGCVNPPDRARRRPGYALTAAQRESLVTYFRELPPERTPAPLDGRFVLAERNCLACHARGSTLGIAGHAPETAAAEPELAPVLAALSPPALTGVGDKLHDEALAVAITLKQPPLRPWLMVRMPRFDLSQDEMRAIIDYFISADRMPELPETSQTSPPPAAAVNIAGSRLVTSAGFGCTSCHQIGKSIPVKVAPAAHGTDLSLVGKRIRRTWYDRWVRNPARIVPRMEMPSIQIPVRGVLDERLDDQLAAVWNVLNTPGFDPPQPNPVRVIRAHNVPGESEPAAVLTDVLEVGDRVFPKPLVVGLRNRHNVLIDLAANRLAGWWIGDTASQRTRGKSWYWDSGRSHVLPPSEPDAESELALRRDGRLWPQTAVGQFAAELDWYESTADGLSFGYRLQHGDDAKAKDGEKLAATATLNVVQTVTALPGDSTQGGGFRRRIEIRGAKAGDVIELTVAPGFGKPTSVSQQAALYTADSGRTEIRVTTPATVAYAPGPAGPQLSLVAGAGQPIVCELDYVTDLPADRYIPAGLEDEPEKAVLLNVVPGYQAVRLPLPPTEMPTGLAWRDDGSLIFCSLKGSVWVARDTDGDGLEDRQTLFADGLPAPYGIAADGDAIDVCAKYALLRLSDADGDGRAERATVAASGWGYTTDYHDWAVGLPRDSAGNYYMSFPCQQDKRSARAALLRGTVVELLPRTPTADNPRLFDLRQIAAGLRFPMGLAMNRAGDLFCTDNQGNYTPFNELNHVVAGTRYGFINKLEQKPGFQPPFQPAAVNIPHPWTRSINGICFLNTPPAAQKPAGRKMFGPWEGHLVGCEINTQRLIRMSLERVGDVYQGAVYPLSLELAPGEETFEGPISCGIAPDGDLYVGNLRDSGWGGGQNTGSLVRLRPNGELPAGIAEVRAAADGFTIHFARPVDRQAAGDLRNYAVSSYRRIPTPAYGGPDADREPARIKTIEVSADGRQARLKLTALRTGFVYEFRLKNLAPAGEMFFPAEAHYTLQEIVR